MTYRRESDGDAAATTACARAVGEWRLAERLGLSASGRCQRMSPIRPDALAWAKAAEADVACAAAGAGTPHFDEFGRRLRAAGAIRSRLCDCGLVVAIRTAIVACVISAALSFPAAGIAEGDGLILPVGMDMACGPRADVDRALMNAGFRRIWRGTADPYSPTVLWESFSREWLITTTRDDGRTCVAVTGWESTRQ